MTEKQIPKLAGILVGHQNFFGSLSTEDAEFVIKQPQSAIAIMTEAITNRVKDVVQKLLAFVTGFSATTVTEFKAADFFIEGREVDGVKTAWMSEKFEEVILPLHETGIKATTIRIHELKKESKDLGIRTELGEANEDIKLAHFFQVLKAKPTDDKIGSWLVAYIYGSDGNLWAVYGHLCDGGWDLGAYSVEDAYEWSASYQFCSR